MAEYLAPGVYVEEFESGPKAMDATAAKSADGPVVVEALDPALARCGGT